MLPLMMMNTVMMMMMIIIKWMHEKPGLSYAKFRSNEEASIVDCTLQSGHQGHAHNIVPAAVWALKQLNK